MSHVVTATPRTKNNGDALSHKHARIAFAEDVQGGSDGTDAQSNPQDAGLNGVNTAPFPPPTSVPHSTGRRRVASQSWKLRKRGRAVRVATIDSSNPSSLPALPTNQYNTILTRRAIYKLDDLPEGQQATEDHGDISLGMKLIIAGGRVIVQSLNSLKDGRASPAQLTGVIQRGDVLLAVGEVSLANMPIDQLMNGLKPLSAPLEGGKYQRQVRVRLEAGAGLDLLESHERGLSASLLAEGQATAVNDMFALFPMVDQLSGAPLIFQKARDDTVSTAIETKPSKELLQPQMMDDQDMTVGNGTPDELIATLVARQRTLDRELFTSEYFNWSERFSQLLRAIQASNDPSVKGAARTKSERIELGIQVMTLARSLTYTMEDLGKGKDLRSFKMWSTNFSLRSGASARRRHVMDTASLRSHRRHDLDDSISERDESEASGSMGSIDGDALLLGLAAHDEIWRKQIIDALKESIDRMNNGEDDESLNDQKTDDYSDDINAALSNELGAFLFGDNMNSIIKKKKKSYSLPPEEITTVLFDLTTQITTSAPDEVTTFAGTSNSFSYHSSFGTQGKARAQHRTNILLANRFLLDDVLPVWLESFRPLGLEHRRLFWPKISRVNAGSNGGTNTHNSDNDSLTVDTHGSGSRHENRGIKTLEEMVEDLELDVETRSETCFLVTYYFTHQILSMYMGNAQELELDQVDDQVRTFVQKYGTYLQIHSCLVFSASAKAERTIDALLDVAKYDPSHLEAMAEFKRANNMTFYEAGKLSALLQCLGEIRRETSERQRLIKTLCVSAYPDLQPWQVKKACIGQTMKQDSRKSSVDEGLPELYYSYLSQLLDPIEGQEAARQNGKLVEEWCQWSIGIGHESFQKRDSDRIQNFYLVASRTSSAHLAYRRDLPTLLEMSMAISEYNLALELTTEIIEDQKLCERAKTIQRVLVCLREIATEALGLAWKSRSDGSNFHMLKRVLRALHQMSTSSFRSCKESINVPEELVSMLEAWETKSTSEDSVADVLILIDFMINESAPNDVLNALVLWRSSPQMGSASFSTLDLLLRRGVQVALKGELSGSLLRLKYLRRSYMHNNTPETKGHTITEGQQDNGKIWKQMSLGTLSIDK